MFREKAHPRIFNPSAAILKLLAWFPSNGRKVPPLSIPFPSSPSSLALSEAGSQGPVSYTHLTLPTKRIV